MTNKGLSRFIPDAVLDAYKPALADGWEVACFLFMAAVWLAVIANFIVDFSVSFDSGFEGLWEGPTLFVTGPILIVIFTLVVRNGAPRSTPRGLWLLDGALTLAFLFGLLTIAAGVIGIFSSFSESGFGFVLGAIIFHVADIALGVVVVVWSLNELAVVRTHSPVTATTVSAAPASWAAAAPTAAPASAAPGDAGTAPGTVPPPPPAPPA
jgi:uncharacterized membrane protein HdeD (DUF308 family)